MRLISAELKREALLRDSTKFEPVPGKIEIVKRKNYRIIRGATVMGDAPKELMKIYFFKPGEIRINRPSLWDTYIVKTGHKWYPTESITEYVLNRLGCALGLKMAESKLAIINGQLRFLSKLFRTEKYQMLEHGAEIYSGYLDNDKAFVEEIEHKNMARQFFTLSFTYDALRSIYPFQYEDIFLDFVRMLVFDAIIGNNDRHFYNWAVLKDLKNRHQPYFTPIYDTARALFWNHEEGKLKDIYADPNRKAQVVSGYVRKSKPKIGVEKTVNPNHFDIIKKLHSDSFEGTKVVVESMLNSENKDRCLRLIKEDLAYLLSDARKDLIINCLNLRFDQLIEVLKK